MMTYEVPDVEHIGDVNNKIYRLTCMGAKVVDSEIRWGDEEIDEAYLFIEVKDEDMQKFKDYGCY